MTLNDRRRAKYKVLVQEFHAEKQRLLDLREEAGDEEAVQSLDADIRIHLREKRVETQSGSELCPECDAISMEYLGRELGNGGVLGAACYRCEICGYKEEQPRE